MKNAKFLIVILMITVNCAIGQVSTPVFSPALSPHIEWTSISWSPLKNDWITPQNQDESGEDWLMDVIEYYENGVHVGYAACGFSSWRDFEIYNEYAPCADSNFSNYIDAELFYTDENKRGILRQTVGIYDLKGDLVHLYRYNIGTFFKIYQDSNGDLIATGNSLNPIPFDGETHMDVPMYVNPISGNNPQGFSTYELANFPTGFCSSPTPDRGSEFNVVRIQPNGDVVYNNYYNNGTTLQESFYSGGVGGGIAPADGNNIYVVGSFDGHPSIIKLDENGHVIWKMHRPAMVDGQYFWIDKYQDKYVLSGRYLDPWGVDGIVRSTAFMEYIDLDGAGSDEIAFANPEWDEHTTEANGYGNYGFNFTSGAPTWIGEHHHASKSICFT